MGGGEGVDGSSGGRKEGSGRGEAGRAGGEWEPSCTEQHINKGCKFGKGGSILILYIDTLKGRQHIRQSIRQ